jgi:hypothetical protein
MHPQNATEQLDECLQLRDVGPSFTPLANLDICSYTGTIQRFIHHDHAVYLTSPLWASWPSTPVHELRSAQISSAQYLP